MTQQLSLFDLGEPIKPEPKKKSGGKIAKAEDNSENGKTEQSIAEVAVQAQEKNIEPHEFFFFVANDIVVDKTENIEEEEDDDDVQLLTDKAIVTSEKEVVFDEELIVFTQNENIEDITEEANTPNSEEPTVYEPDEKITTIRKRGRKSFKEIDAEVDLISIPDDDELFKKQYYSITEVAKWFRVNNSLLRFWENEFPILKPRKNKKGDRMFRPEDVKNLQVIYYLLRQRKFTIDGARKYMKANKDNIEVNLKLIQSLNKFKGFLLELKANTEK